MPTFIDRLVFPSPTPSYDKDTFRKHLCWIPWNEAVSPPERFDDEKCAEGIPCIWLPAPKAAGVMLFCHGNAEDLGMCFPFLRHMRDQFKMNIFAVEYPGYGLLHGISATEAALKEAALTAFRFILDELRVAFEQIMIFGRSVGSGPSVYLASRFPVGGLILVAAFASIREAAKSLVGGVLAQVLDERFPNIALIGNVSCPTLIIHGEKDSLVPPSHSVALFKHCRARKLLITPPGMEHNTNLFTDAQFLAIPAINFFGLPGYQQESPPKMPARFFKDGRQAFMMRQARKAPKQDSAASANPWFFFCGCPTSRPGGRPAGGGADAAIAQRMGTGLLHDDDGPGDMEPSVLGRLDDGLALPAEREHHTQIWNPGSSGSMEAPLDSAAFGGTVRRTSTGRPHAEPDSEQAASGTNAAGEGSPTGFEPFEEAASARSDDQAVGNEEAEGLRVGGPF